ncbi:MAG: hypothetical protein GWN58_01835 [Anaerolineae bacterium]|nr:hypothetical protein [Anaerolineae bacterium]
MLREKIEGISSGYRSLDKEVEQLEAQLTWARTVLKHRERLDPIADIVKLGCLWREPSLWCSDKPVLRLAYTGAALNHKEAAADLGRIMDALHCQDLELKPIGGGDRRPSGEYHGEGKLGDEEISIRLDVPWLPEGCRVHASEPRRTWSTARRYSVYCRTR